MTPAPTLALDHILWAAPDLAEGAELFARLAGVAPSPGGAHPGFGTRNMLVGLQDGIYFELIAPDPAQPLHDNWGAEIAALPGPGMRGFAVRTDDLPGLRARAATAGLETVGPVAMSRLRQDGVRLEWSILQLRHAALRAAIPFAIDWGGTPHPSASLPPSCRLVSLHALHPDADALRRCYATLGIGVAVHAGVHPGFVAVLETPRGEMTLTSR